MQDNEQDLGFLNEVKAGLEDGLGLDPASLAAIRLVAMRENPVRRRRSRIRLALAAAAGLVLALGLGILLQERGTPAEADVPLTVQTIALIEACEDPDCEVVVAEGDSAACESLLAWQDAPYEEVAKTEILEDNILP